MARSVHKIFTKKLALASCKNITDFVLFYHVTKTVENIVKSMV